METISFDIGGTLIDFKRNFNLEKRIGSIITTSNESKSFCMKDYIDKSYDKQALAYNICANFGKPELEDKVVTILDEYCVEPIIVPGAIKVLQYLHTKYNLITISNAYYWNIIDLKKCGLNFFSKCYYSSEIGYSKPDINLFKYVKEQLNVSPSDITHVGDSLKSDVIGANKAGWKTVFFDRKGNFSNNNIIPCCDQIIYYLYELKKIF